MGKVIQFPAARSRPQAKASGAGRAAPSAGVFGAWLALVEINLRAWRMFGRSLAPAETTAAEREREAVGSK